MKSHRHFRFFTMWFKYVRHLIAKFSSSNFSWFQCLLILFTASFDIFTLIEKNNKPYGETILNVKLSMFLEPWIIPKHVFFKAFLLILTFYSLCIYNFYVLIFSCMLDVSHILFLIIITSYRSRFSKFHFTNERTDTWRD